MVMSSDDLRTFTEIRDRLNEIADAVSGEGIALDDALDLYDEAVKLGMKAADLLEASDAADASAAAAEASATSDAAADAPTAPADAAHGERASAE